VARWHPGFGRVNGKRSFLLFFRIFIVHNTAFRLRFLDLADKFLHSQDSHVFHVEISLFLSLPVVESHILASAVCPNFPKLVSNLVKLPIENMDSDPNRNVGRTDLSGELGSVPAPPGKLIRRLF